MFKVMNNFQSYEKYDMLVGYIQYNENANEALEIYLNKWVSHS